MAAPVQVRAHAGHQVAGAVGVEELHVAVLHFPEQPAAQVEDHILGGLLQEDHHHVAHAFTPELDGEHDGQDAQQRIGIAGDDDVVDQAARERRVDQQQHAGERADAQRGGMAPPERRIHILPEPLNLLAHAKHPPSRR